MAKHRAPTQIEIASPLQRTGLHDFVDRYWKAALFLGVAATGGILFQQWRSQSSHEVDAAHWNDLRQQVSFGSGFGAGPITTPAAAALVTLGEQFGTSPIGSWTKALEVGKHLEEEDFQEAERALSELKATWPDHPLASEAMFPECDGLVTLQQRLASRSKALEAWEAAHPLLFANPDLPADAPRVRLKTSQGDIVVGLYADRAPAHTANFLERCQEGAYDGTRFHRILPNQRVEGGDPNSVDGEPETWGRGGPEETLDAEKDPQLRHFAGVLGMAPKGDGSNKSLFYLTVDPDHVRDGKSTIFGQVLEGLEIVRGISNGAVIDLRPQDPVVLETTEVL